MSIIFVTSLFLFSRCDKTNMLNAKYLSICSLFCKKYAVFNKYSSQPLLCVDIHVLSDNSMQGKPGVLITSGRL